MKLLLDQNLSPDLVAPIRGFFPGSTHVRDLGLSRADDLTIWTVAQEQGFTIVSDAFTEDAEAAFLSLR